VYIITQLMLKITSVSNNVAQGVLIL